MVGAARWYVFPAVVLGGALCNCADAAIKLGVQLEDNNQGTQVITVFRGHRGQKIGLRRGDYLVRVNGRNVESASHFADVLKRTNSIRVTWRRGERYYRGRVSRVVTTGKGEDEYSVEEGKEISGPSDPE